MQTPDPVSSDDGYSIFHDLLPAEAASGLPGQPAAQHPGGVPEQADRFQVKPTAEDSGAVPEQTNRFHVQPAAQHPSQGPGEGSLQKYAGQPNSKDYGSHPGAQGMSSPAMLEPGAETRGTQSSGQQLMQVKHAR